MTVGVGAVPAATTPTVAVSAILNHSPQPRTLQLSRLGARLLMIAAQVAFPTTQPR